MIERLDSLHRVRSGAPVNQSAAAPAGTFGDLLRQRFETVGTEPQSAPGAIEMTKHAQLRAAERGIELTADLMARLSDSAHRAQAKGAKNILVFDATRAFIVNVPQNRVITAISQDEMQDNVFTNIDGAVLLR